MVWYSHGLTSSLHHFLDITTRYLRNLVNVDLAALPEIQLKPSQEVSGRTEPVIFHLSSWWLASRLS